MNVTTATSGKAKQQWKPWPSGRAFTIFSANGRRERREKASAALREMDCEGLLCQLGVIRIQWPFGDGQIGAAEEASFDSNVRDPRVWGPGAQLEIADDLYLPDENGRLLHESGGLMDDHAGVGIDPDLSFHQSDAFEPRCDLKHVGHGSIGLHGT
jgi:hypothetical protein